MRNALIIIIAFNILRFAVLPFTGLMPQEAYFTYFGEHIALSYYDHPPLIGYILFSFLAIGGKHVLTIKLAAFIFTVLSQLAFFKFSALILRGNRKYMAWILFSSSIMVSSLSIVTCPDVLLIFFWILSLWTLYIAIFDNKWWGWLFAGLMMGTAFNSKYPAISIPSGLILFLIFSNRYRRLLATPWPYISLIIAALLTLPVFIWNAQNQFASLSLNSLDRAEPFDGFKPDNFLVMSAVQLLLLLPVIFVGLWWMMFKYFGRIFKKPNQINSELWFLLCFFLPVFMGLYMVSVFGEVKYNWLLPTYISGIILLSRFLKYRWLKWQIGFSIVFHGLFYYAIFSSPNRIINEDTGNGWKELSSKVDSIRNEYPKAFVFATDSYKSTAELSFFLNDTIFGPSVIGIPGYQFDFSGIKPDAIIGHDGIYLERMEIGSNKAMKNTYNLLAYFTRIEELEPIIVKEKENRLLAYKVFYCSDYKGSRR